MLDLLHRIEDAADVLAANVEAEEFNAEGEAREALREIRWMLEDLEAKARDTERWAKSAGVV